MSNKISKSKFLMGNAETRLGFFELESGFTVVMRGAILFTSHLIQRAFVDV